MRSLYIFDLDGTLALTEHRQHLLDEKDDPGRWAKFFAASKFDAPNTPVIETLQRLMVTSDVWIWSGRSDEVKRDTIQWLAKHTTVPSWDVEAMLKMRPAGDYTANDELKLSWLDTMLPTDRKRLVAIFDDRDKVVAMWRTNGVACFQVAPGGF